MVGQVRSETRYDLELSLKLFDEDGTLPGRARALWSLIEDDADRIARCYW